MRARLFSAAVLGLSTLALSIAVTPSVLVAHASPRAERSGTAGTGGLGDQRLRESIAQAVGQAGKRSEGSSSDPWIGVEAMGSATSEIDAAIRQLGGIVTGSVDGQVVQARVPVSIIDDLAATTTVRSLQAPRRVTRGPQPQLRTLQRAHNAEIGPGFGATVGVNTSLAGAVGWQSAGIDGSVKVGIIDYFDFGLWNPAENGPQPDTQAPDAVDPNGHSSGRTFCLDTSGFSPNYCPMSSDGINDGNGDEHGVAVAQVIKDMAPAAQLYLATVATVSDLRAAIEWFALNGVPIVTRSLGAAYDGPGDGTGPLDTVVDFAAARGITWFNSAGNEAVDGYLRTTVPANLSATGGYVDFDNGPGIDTYLRISGGCIGLDGVRWSDWGLPADQRSDYVVELYEPRTNPDPFADENFNPSNLALLDTLDDLQIYTAPLEGADYSICPANSFGFADGITYMRVRRKSATPVVGTADILEVATSFGVMELGRSQAAYSAAKPVVDSANPALVAVGAIDPAVQTMPQVGEVIAAYSSQGPTNDGRIKPDVTAPSCVASTVYAPDCFNGTSAASPSAAGMAALLLDAGIALPGAHLAAAVKHFVIDRGFGSGTLPLFGGADGPDNKYGTGQIALPAADFNIPRAIPSTFVPQTPTRILDTRTLAGVVQPSHRTYDVIDVDLTGVISWPATAIAVNITSTDTATPGFVQVVPYLAAPLGASSTLNIATAGIAKPNFTIVPISRFSPKISIYMPPGGHVIVDLLGLFSETRAAVGAGRFVPITPERQLDTRSSDLVPSGWAPHKPANETVQLTLPASSAVPTTGVSALVLNVTSTQGTGIGYLRAQPTGTVPPSSTVNYTANTDSANTVIVPLGEDGTVSVYTSGASHIIADVTGYITSDSEVASLTGRFVPISPTRAYDSRPNGALATGTARSVGVGGLAAALVPFYPTLVGDVDFATSPPAGVSLNLTAVNETNFGFLTAYPAGGALPPTSSLNYQPGAAVANGALLKLSSTGGLDVFSSAESDFIIDINGFFTG